ncbi:MAG TPA: protein kinase, partial [Pirellulales bacterium]|nr:protein kinase [Pirellulales bacterium]
MSESSLRRNPVEELAEEFLNRYRRGERPSISEYARRHPDLANDIRDLFPSLAMMEEAGGFSATGATAASVPDRLGDYRIVREVGRGGMGVVYEAVQESLGRHVALKVLPSESSHDRVRRFRHEARSAARLHHTNIVPVFEVGEHGGTNYYAMQFIQGQSLDEVMRELKRLRADRRTAAGEPQPPDDNAPSYPLSAELARALASGPLPNTLECARNDKSAVTPAPLGESSGRPADPGKPPSPGDVTDAVSNSCSSTSELTSQSDFHYYRSVARIGVQVAEALSHAHAQRVLHRDIKPSNLLLDLQGTAWVTDFGLAKEEGDDLTQTGDLVGTLRFMAPERFRGNADARSDIYSLGLTLYELLALRPAFDEADRGRLIRQITQSQPPRPRTIDHHVPRDMETIVLKAIAKEPAARYQAASDMAEDLRRFLSDRPILARRSSPLEQTWRWCRRNPLVAGLAALVVVLLATVATVSSVAALRLHDEQEAMRNQLQLTEQAERIAEQRAEEIRLAAERQHTADALIQKAGMLADFGHWREANQAFQQAIVLRPESSLARHQRGMFYGRLALWEMAADDFADGFRLQAPDHPRFWFAHGLLRAYLRDERGYRDLQERVDERLRQPRNFLGHENELVRVGTLMPCSRDLAKWLVEVARQAVKDEPHMAYTNYALGLAEYQQGDYEAALAAFEQSLRVGAHWTQGGLAHTGIALCRHRLGQASKARQALARAAKVMDDGAGVAVHSPPGRSPIGLWYDWLECLVRFRDASLAIEGSPPPEDARLLMFRAKALAAIDETDGAVEACRRARTLEPDNVSIRRACLGVLADLGPTHADFALEAEGNQPDAKDRQACLSAFVQSVERGDWERARADCSALRQRWPDD